MFAAAVRIALISTAVLGGCASGPGAPGNSEFATVSYRQRGEHPIQHTLISSAVVDRGAFYSELGSDKLTKVLDAAAMPELLDRLADYGLFQHARGVEAPDSSSEIIVRMDDQEYIWSKPSLADPDQASRYSEAWVLILNVFNQTQSFHVGRGDGGVLEQHKRLEDQRRAYFRDRGERR